MYNSGQSVDELQAFRRNVWPSYLWSRSKPIKKTAWIRQQVELLACTRRYATCIQLASPWKMLGTIAIWEKQEGKLYTCQDLGTSRPWFRCYPHCGAYRRVQARSSTCCLIHAVFLIGLLLDHKHEGHTFLRNACSSSTDCPELYT
jgi:hypothetical protein